ncbi:hypothetical protein XANCAGTX0491_009892 [Xanthoria calcicola]
MSSPSVGSDPIPGTGYTAGSDSPTSPPFSPITPVMSSESLSQSSQNQNASQATKVLPLQPFSESDNPDAIALRSAISVLQIQRQQALRDLAALEKQKKLAAADPKAFAMDLMTGEVKEVATGPLSSQTGFPLPSNDVQKENDEQVESDTQAHQKTKHPAFGDIPGSQDVVRCPPIEWAKYHVLGQPLDTLHEEQRKRPLDGQRSEDAQDRRAEHVIAAPYDPFSDRLAPKLTKPAPGSSGSQG